MTDVLVNGAGPTGLVLALYLTKQGIRVHITDRSASTPSTSRAMALHARTLELYRQLGIAEDVVNAGHKLRKANMWFGGVHRATVPLGDVGAGLTPYPFIHIFPQDQHERLLESKLNAMGVFVERGKELVSFTEHDDHIEAHFRATPPKEDDSTPTLTSTPDLDPDADPLETISASYLAGCDGAHSAVRHTANITFSGASYAQWFFVADIQGHGAALNGESHVSINGSDFLLLFPYSGHSAARVTGILNTEQFAKPASELTIHDIPSHMLPLTVERVNWFTPYHVHHRVAERFRAGKRAFLVGDAGHIHSPVGGQGMNTGIGDAVNLAWKVAAVVKGNAEPALLDSYEEERRAFATTLVETTDTAFNVIVSQGYLASLVRGWVVPLVMPWLMTLSGVRRSMFSRVSQIMVNYRGMKLSGGGGEGSVQGGDRMPWVMVGEKDNFDALRKIQWQVHVYGAVGDDLEAWCATKGVALHVFPWDDKYGTAGLQQDAAYLIRPDTYVAVVESTASVSRFEQYFQDVGICL